jgi:hypothetical protein
MSPTCAACGTSVVPGSRFCHGCGARLPLPRPSLPERFASPISYTPPHLAERILADRSALEGEHKRLTVRFTKIDRPYLVSLRNMPEVFSESDISMNRTPWPSDYLRTLSSALAADWNLQYFGDWHSHHRLGLCGPSSGDRRRILRLAHATRSRRCRR